MFKGKNVLITGGTGSLGKALTQKLLKLDVNTIRIFSRDEDKQANMAENFNDSRLRFLIGDIRDKERLQRSVENMDIVIHTAALKQVPVAEYNPFEFIKTNVYGSQNVIDVSMDEEVELCLGVSTDKAVSPLNLYGATKLAMEKLFITANHYKGNRKTKFSCVRYGNVLGSRGSVIPRFIEQIKTKQKITVTDPQMTRFNITMDDALELIISAIKLAKGSEVFIPKLKSYKLSDLVEVIKEMSKISFKIESITRSGEKLHEVLLNEYEVNYTVELDKLFVLFPTELDDVKELQKKYSKRKPVKFKIYSSDSVPLLTKTEIKKLLQKHTQIP